MSLEIYQTVNEDMKTHVMELYHESFGKGFSAQHIDSLWLSGFMDFIFEKGEVWVAVENGYLLAVLLAHSLVYDKDFPASLMTDDAKNHCIYISDLMVASVARKKGIGELLTSTFLDAMKMKSYDQSVIRVWDQNLPALHLYEKLGFESFAQILQTKHKPESLDETFEMKKIYLRKSLKQS